MNLEDGADEKPNFLVDVSRQNEIIHAVLEAAASASVPFVLNARTDIFLYGIGPANTRLERAIDRLNSYHAAGAQSVFTPGVKDAETIEQTCARSWRTAEHPGDGWHAIGCGAAATGRCASKRRVRTDAGYPLVF